MQMTDKFIGKHGLFTLRNVNPEHLKNIEIVRKKLWSVAKECDLNIVSESGHQFEPFGVTYVFVLAESHLSIHTYPENGNAYLDLFTCVLEFDMTRAVNALMNHFGDDIIVDFESRMR